MADIPPRDELITFAFALHSNPGAYALLLGAGVSPPSGIPTAWGVLEDLVRQAAQLRGADPEDAIGWFKSQFGEYPTYEGVLELLAPTQVERQRLLRGYFERSSDDIDADKKSPTLAHRSIARLVRRGALKVIVTLNFDHLMEQALRAEGIEPTVVASPADVEGMAPLHTLECCVVHLHGDYMNPTSMLNTVSELAGYHAATEKLLRVIVENYGLIIAGWSSTYDPALRDMIAASYPRRFTLAWLEPFEPSPEATRLRTLKSGRLIAESADIALGTLADGVDALAARKSRHPLTIPIAVETAKRELSGKTVAIGLHDTLRREFESLHRLPEFHLANYQTAADYEGLLSRIEEATRLPASLVATLAYWGDHTTDPWWMDEIARFAVPRDGSGLVKLLSLRVVAGSMLFYSAGVAATTAGRHDLLRRLFGLRRPNRYNGGFESLASRLDAAAGYEGAQRTNTRLFEEIAPLLRDALTLGVEPLDHAWQTFELARMTYASQAHPRFSQLASDFQSFDADFKNRESEVEQAQKAGGAALGQALSNRQSAWTDRDRVLGSIGRLAANGRPHVLVADERGDDGYHSVVARTLLDEIEAERSTHPFAIHAYLADPDATLLALHAISRVLGASGRELSWSRVQGSVGVIPSSIWLDTGATPEETSALRERDSSS